MKADSEMLNVFTVDVEDYFGYWRRLVYQQTPEEFRTDLRRSRATCCKRPLAGR